MGNIAKKNHVLRNIEAYQYKVLDPDFHYVLVEKIDQYAKEAGIPKKYIYQSILDFATNGNPEIDWMRGYSSHRKKGIYGICFVGVPQHLQRMSAMVGACLRNYISARLTNTYSLVTQLREGSMPNEELLAVGNFCLGQMVGGDIPSWQIPMLLGFLYDRFSSEQYTIVYADSLSSIKKVYGPTMLEHIESYFDIINS